MRACVCVRVRACVRVCVCMCACACERACVCVYLLHGHLGAACGEVFDVDEDHRRLLHHTRLQRLHTHTISLCLCLDLCLTLCLTLTLCVAVCVSLSLPLSLPLAFTVFTPSIPRPLALSSLPLLRTQSINHPCTHAHTPPTHARSLPHGPLGITTRPLSPAECSGCTSRNC